MSQKLTNSLRFIFSDLDISQKELGSILGITQAGVSKKISSLNFTIEDIVKISEAKKIDFFYELRNLLSEPIRNNHSSKESYSEIERAIINLVKNIK